jgi:tetratricopeptide (TPR) repeat protein
MSENPWLEPLKNDTKLFVKKHPWVARIIGTTILAVALFLIIPSLRNSWDVTANLFSGSDNKEKEDTENWLRENFLDSTYNILILPFNDYQENANQGVKIEKALEQRFDELRVKFFPGAQIKLSMKIKCYLEIPEFLSADSINAIGNLFKADLIIYGDIYDLFDKPSKRTNIKYSVLQKTKKVFPFKTMGETKLIEFNSLDEIRNGYLIKDIDYLTIWIFCNEQLNQGNIDKAIIILDAIDRNFSEKIFNKNSSFLTAFIGEDYYKIGDLINAKRYLLKSKDLNEIAEILSLLGNVYYKLNELDSSKYYQLKAYNKKPNSYMVNVNLGNLFMNIGNYGNAKYHFKNAIQLDGSNARAYYNLGYLYGRYLNVPDSALICFSNAIKYEPDKQLHFITS